MTDTTRIQTTEDTDEVVLASDEQLFSGQFLRHGDNLVVASNDGAQTVVEG